MSDVEGVFTPFDEVVGIPGLRETQDWDLVHADPSRVEEFCRLYEEAPLSPLDRHDLMSLIVASLDDLLSQRGSQPSLEQKVEHLLTRDAHARAGIVDYWAAPLRDPVWRVTPMMRRVQRGASARP